MPRNEAEKNISSMPMEHMIEAPIIAAAKAQREISGMLADYLDKSALDFKGDAGMQPLYVPLKEMSGLSIEAEQGKISAALSYSPEYSRRTDTDKKYTFHVEAKSHRDTGKIKGGPSMIVQRSKAQTDAQTIAILEARKSQIPQMEQMAEKAQEAINLVQTAEGVLQAVWEILQRIKELAMQAASDAVTAEELGLIREENSQLQYEVDRLVSGKEISRLKQYRTSEKEITLHFGESEAECITFPFEEFSTMELGVDASHVNLSTPEHASESMPYVDAALDKVTRQRGVLDAVRNRLEQVKNLVEYM